VGAGTTKGVSSANGNGATMVAERPFTGGAIDFRRATAPLTPRPMANAKTVVMVRHGLSSWNEEGRVQVSASWHSCKVVWKLKLTKTKQKTELFCKFIISELNQLPKKKAAFSMKSKVILLLSKVSPF
jgi:hypothetical protein